MPTNSWDDWVPQDRVRKFTDENKELAAQLHTQMRNLQRQSKGVGKNPKGSRANGSEMGSGRGSEERNPSLAAQSSRRGRNRDYDLEPVSDSNLIDYFLCCFTSISRHFWFPSSGLLAIVGLDQELGLFHPAPSLLVDTFFFSMSISTKLQLWDPSRIISPTSIVRVNHWTKRHQPPSIQHHHLYKIPNPVY